MSAVALLVLLFLICVSICSGALFLRFGLDALLLHPAPLRGTRETALLKVHAAPDGYCLVRRYGRDLGVRTIIFFPGQRGNIPRYEEDLFRPLEAKGCTVYAVSYPGQDGSTGSPRLSMLEPTIVAILAAIESDAGRPTSDMVFVGHSLGASVAVLAARRCGSSRIVADGLSPSLVHAVRAHLAQNWLSAPLALLPIRSLLPAAFDLGPALRQMQDTPVLIFQGSNDRRTSLSDALAMARGCANVIVHRVDGAGHDDVIGLISDRYVEAIVAPLP
ncbi:MAG: alpha/beta hydrolase [Roseiarcus sp.]|uniref:alpha/beta hydrolase n=1 Tax=Roseiarcus sp. TaxID=1969460 RepID=UPI003C3B482E